MKNLIKLEELSHRSKERIKNLGEVFTPEFYVEDMLELLVKDRKEIWADENVVFFEPCCGHGNIVLPIYRRRLEAFYKKAVSQGLKEAPYYAVANALNNLWAIDIDPKNIENCRSRVLLETLNFLKNKFAIQNNLILFKKKDFFAHVLSAIKWQIDENETLSALSEPQGAKLNAGLTKTGTKWFSQNGHHQIDFDLSWVRFYEENEEFHTIPLEYERSHRFIESILSGKTRGYEDYEFARAIMEIDKDSEREQGSIRSISVAA